MNKYKNMFLQQSYEDSMQTYLSVLKNNKALYWDYIVLTASNENQAQIFRAQIANRIKDKSLPSQAKYLVVSDPDGKRVGSGGATLNVLKTIVELEGGDNFDNLKILILHSGGDSKRVPQYSACGKIFSPIPRCLPNGKRSTVFDEFIISLSDVPARIPAGVFVVSGDVLLLFNPLQVDFCTNGAAAFTFKEPVSLGEHHGVFLPDYDGNVGSFLHKRSKDELNKCGAVDSDGNICLDTGAIALDSNVVKSLWKLVDNEESFNHFVNEKVRLNFYSDFLFPMASYATCESYLKEAPEYEYSDELTSCRVALWDALHNYRINLLHLSPALFLHFGTTAELLKCYNTDIDDYSCLGWSKHINSNTTSHWFSASNSYINDDAEIGEGSYIEDSYIGNGCKIGENCIISCLMLEDVVVPNNTVLHGLKLKNGKFTVRMYSVNDNPKEAYLLEKKLPVSLWDYDCFPVCDTIQEACNAVLNNKESLYELISLKDSFEEADDRGLSDWQEKMFAYAQADKLVREIKSNTPVDSIADKDGINCTKRTIKLLLDGLKDFDFSTRIRVYYYLYKIKEQDKYLAGCFKEIQKELISGRQIIYNKTLRTDKDCSEIRLPIRVNWGGGWSDTPPYCNEHGGHVLNAALYLENKLPICAIVKKSEDRTIKLRCEDNGAESCFNSIKDFQDFNNPYDSFAIQKAALIVFGVIPRTEDVDLQEIIARTGGFSLTTSVIDIPRGSGLGTSSILSCACLLALSDYFNKPLSVDEINLMVLQIEQLMSTGGGWQDHLGGMLPGIKLLSSEKGIKQTVQFENVDLSEETKEELDERFCLIYSGQRRLARNLLRSIMGRYIGNDPVLLDSLQKIQDISKDMRSALENGDIDCFSRLLNEHWRYSKLLDPGSTNTCIEQIFNVCDDMIDGRMICGAGGGGFLQVILKKGVSKNELDNRLKSVFGYSGVRVYESSFCWTQND